MPRTTARFDEQPISARSYARVIAAERALAAEDSDYEPLDTRPTWRGWLHVGAFIAAVAQSAVLIPLAAAEGGRQVLGAAIYSASMLAMFGVSALYHRRRWSSRGWKVMKRLDHSMIFLFIAGTYAPFGLVALEGALRWWILGVVWTGAVAGIVLKLFWPTAPRWVGVPIYVVIGWTAVFALGPLLRNGGVAALVLLLVGGVLYTVGAVAYASKWPDLAPGHFGYHEFFHALTIGAAICHYIAVMLMMYYASGLS